MTGTVVKVDDEGVRVIVSDRLLGICRAARAEPEGPVLGSDLELVVEGYDREGRRLELIVAGIEAVGA